MVDVNGVRIIRNQRFLKVDGHKEVKLQNEECHSGSVRRGERLR